MGFLAAVRVAFGALLVHKGRSVLTSLGIVIGIAAVIAMVSAGNGVQRKLDEGMATVGRNLVLIRAGNRTRGTVADTTYFTKDDAAAIRKQVGPLLNGLAEVQLTQRQVTTKSTHWSTIVCGTTPELGIVREWKIHSGRFITPDDVSRIDPVCVIGNTVRKELFGDVVDPLGQTLRIDRLQLRIVGVLAPKGRDPVGTDQDDEIFVPISTLQRKIVGEEKVALIIAGVRSEALTHRAIDRIKSVLSQTHKVKAGSPDFDVSSVEEMADLGRTVTTTVGMLIAVIASLSLLVGGIGIMNIMLVSVTERTREIGLRMAVGATSADVLAQFLIEAVILAMAGGLLGITLGVAAAAALAAGAGWPMVVSPFAVLLACGVSGAVGIFFGFYPAWKASRLDPIDALRYE